MGSTMEAQQLHDSNHLLPLSQYINTDLIFSILAEQLCSVIVVKFTRHSACSAKMVSDILDCIHNFYINFVFIDSFVVAIVLYFVTSYRLSPPCCFWLVS